MQIMVFPIPEKGESLVIEIDHVVTVTTDMARG